MQPTKPKQKRKRFPQNPVDADRAYQVEFKRWVEFEQFVLMIYGIGLIFLGIFGFMVGIITGFAGAGGFFAFVTLGGFAIWISTRSKRIQEFILKQLEPPVRNRKRLLLKVGLMSIALIGLNLTHPIWFLLIFLLYFFSYMIIVFWQRRKRRNRLEMLDNIRRMPPDLQQTSILS